MIRFALLCGNDHGFEGWFRDGATFEQQAAALSITCPVCGNEKVRKSMMAPAIRRSSRRRTEPNLPVPRPEPAPRADELPDHAKAAIALLRRVREHVERNFENVGERFPEEARRIHYGEADEREIYGQASLEEAEELVEEGIPVRPLPDLPKLDG